MRAAIVLAIVAVGLLAMLRNRFAGLLLYTWFTFFRPQEWSYRTLDQFGLSQVIVIALLMSAALTGVLPNLTTPLAAGTFLFLLWAMATVQWAYDVSRAWLEISFLAPTILVALLSISLTTTRKRLMALVTVAIGSLAVHGVWRVIVGIASGNPHIIDGIGGTFADNNGFALALVRVVFFLIAISRTVGWRWLRIAASVAVPLTVMAVAFTYSRGAFLALGAGVLVFLLLQRRRGVAVVATVAASLVFYATLPSDYTARVSTITTYQEQEDRSALGRLHFWRVAIEMVRDRPVGIGLGNFETAYDEYDFSGGVFGSRRAVHSTHFQALAETGWLGFVLFEGLMVWTILTAARIRRRARAAHAEAPDQRFFESYSNAIIASTVAFLVGGSFLSQIVSELNWFTFAWTAALDRLQKAESIPFAASTATPAVLGDRPNVLVHAASARGYSRP